MSRSNPRTTIKNPAAKFIKWDGSKGEFSYYDKEKKDNISVPLPVAFLVLDELATVTGFNARTKSNVYSNEVHSTTEEPLNVRCFSGKGGKGYVLAKGLYSEIKPKLIVQVKDVRFTASVYAIMKNENEEFELVNFHFVGSTLNAWIKYKEEHDPYADAIAVKSFVEAESGTVTYRYPRFEPRKVTQETQDIALAFDKNLQEYLKEYKKAQTATFEAQESETKEDKDPSQPNIESDVAADADYKVPGPDSNDDLPF